MLDTIFERAEARVADTAHRASRATTAISDAIEDGLGVAKRAVKHGYDAAEELMEDTQQRIKRHPVEIVVASFAAGALAGILLGWATRRK